LSGERSRHLPLVKAPGGKLKITHRWKAGMTGSVRCLTAWLRDRGLVLARMSSARVSSAAQVAASSGGVS
jgi:hypothetical protein